MAVENAPLAAMRPSKPPSGRGIVAGVRHGIYKVRSRLGMRGLAILAAVPIAAGMALNWSWLVAVGVAPLILTALPCVVMCAIGICMMPKGKQSCGKEPAVDLVSREKPAARALATGPDSEIGTKGSAISR